MRLMAVDHGEKRIGVAISDSTGTISYPLAEVGHTSRKGDAARILELADSHAVERIIVGQSFDEEGNPNPAGRRAERFAEELRSHTKVPVEMWDESLTTQDARTVRLKLGGSRKKRAGHQDSLAAALILQSYLDSKSYHSTTAGE
ncbi:MAG: Holliday junction resolvase RuvX [Chloroflexi bacterium]|nr:Holliday junction resolvase RuvX [Chloroflexota bacterium]